MNNVMVLHLWRGAWNWFNEVIHVKLTCGTSFFGNRCVICQMEYRRGNLQMTLPCKHVYHASCVTRWLSINKVSSLGLKRAYLLISPPASFA